MNRKVIRMRPPVGQSMWIVTNGFRTVSICRFKSDAEAQLANLKNNPWLKDIADTFWIQRGAR